MTTLHSRRHICLLSNNCLDVFPQNRRTSFCNLLAVPIYNSANTTFFVRLRGIGVGFNSYRPAINNPKYINISLFELEEQVSGLRRENRNIGGIPYPPKEADVDLVRKDYIYTTVRNAPYLPLRFNVLQRLQVVLTDEKGQRFSIGYGPATIVLLEIIPEEEMREEGSFTVTCYSLQPETYNHNQLARFTCPMPETFELKNYEVALTNILYPTGMEEEVIAQIMIESEVFSFNLHKFKSALLFFSAVNAEIAKNSAYGKEIRFKPYGARDYFGANSYHMTVKRVALDGQEQKPHLSVRLNYIAWRVVGEAMENAHVLMLKPGEMVHFGRPGQKPDIAYAIPSPIAMLLCDVVEKSWVGSELHPLLTCLPVKHGWTVNYKVGQADKEITWNYEPDNPHYVDVKGTPFDSISFSFNNAGVKNMVERVFKAKDPQNDTIMITLSFRPKK
jgi:hypothetical protein